jgi:hypothetical protein
VQEAERRIEHEQHRNNGSFDIFAQHELKRDGGFEQARHWSNEFAGDEPQLRPNIPQPAPGLGSGQSDE